MITYSTQSKQLLSDKIAIRYDVLNITTYATFTNVNKYTARGYWVFPIGLFLENSCNDFIGSVWVGQGYDILTSDNVDILSNRSLYMPAFNNNGTNSMNYPYNTPTAQSFYLNWAVPVIPLTLGSLSATFFYYLYK